MSRYKKRIIVGLLVGLMLFFASLLYTRHTTSTFYSQENSHLRCGTCGNQELTLIVRGLPFDAYVGFDDETGISTDGLNGTSSWKPLGTIADLVFWIIVAEIGVFTFTTLKTKFRK